jgi:hypothetical protein
MGESKGEGGGKNGDGVVDCAGDGAWWCGRCSRAERRFTAGSGGSMAMLRLGFGLSCDAAVLRP